MKTVGHKRVLSISAALAFSLLGAVSVRAQADAPSAGATLETLTNGQVIALVKAGLSEDAIVLKIRGSKCRFDTTTAALLELREAGVGNAVLAAMLSPEAPAPAAPSEPILEPGVYVRQPDQLQMIEPTVFGNPKTSGGMWAAMSMGAARMKMKVSVPGGRAAVRITQDRPVFEFRFQGIPGLGFPVPGASSPSEFMLLPLAAKDDRRELTVASFGTMGSSTGVSNDQAVPVKVEKLGPGFYRVTPSASLKPGEYCFYYQSPATAVTLGAGGKVFTFGVGAEPSRTVRK